MGASCCKPEVIDFQGEVELGHFELLRSVGKGAFGKVRIVQHKQTKKLYALKYINKKKCIEMSAVENIICERYLLEEIQNPFICNLRFAFQDDENLFMVLDLALGGDLRFHLSRMTHMPEDMVKFYTAEIACGLSYLHSKKIVHRDLKPDNVLLDEQGHATITDFNIAVHYREEKPLTAVAGSMAYMAPEVLRKKGYLNAVDWWSLGVVAYELAYGKLTESIEKDPVDLPPSVGQAQLSVEFRDIILKFLERDLSKRLGAQESGGDVKIREHPWFSPWEWKQVEAKEIAVPFVPDSKKANFDATHELEELLLEENPLKVKPRKKKSNATESDIKHEDESPYEKQIRLMDEKFGVFDYTKGPAAGGVPKTPGMKCEDPMEGRSDAVNVDHLDPDSPTVNGGSPTTPGA
ncbi:putative camp-dependent protein kinase [Zopfochytrium polystomum]|nr:putative camp-dependent protein kinase [Zopfochytrium polystomum]